MKNKKQKDKSTEELRTEAINLLGSLVILDWNEVQERVAKIKFMPREGLEKLIVALRLGTLKQHQYFKILTGEDLLFPEKLKLVLYKNRFNKTKNEA